MTHSLTLAARLGAAAGLASACGLLTACGSTAAPGAAPTRTVTVQASTATSSSAASSSTTAAPAVSTPSATTAAGPSGCLASGLHAEVGSSQGAAGTIYQVIVLTNTSDATCTLYGYPGVSFVTGVGGAQVGLPATKDPVVAKALVTLAPGGQAGFLLGVHDVGAIPTCKVANVGWLRIYPPGDYGSINAPDKTQTCSNANLSTMTVSPVRSGANPSF